MLNGGTIVFLGFIGLVLLIIVLILGGLCFKKCKKIYAVIVKIKNVIFFNVILRFCALAYLGLCFESNMGFRLNNRYLKMNWFMFSALLAGLLISF